MSRLALRLDRRLAQPVASASGRCIIAFAVGALVLAGLAACGGGSSDDTSVTTEAPTATAVAVEPEPANDEPIPVEPDGGIGDGAAPLPGAEVDEPDGDWHGAQVAVTNCPGVDFDRVVASAFAFSVPSDFVDEQAQGIDSEFAVLSTDTIEVSYDYGWYSAPLGEIPGAESTPISYSGIEGEFVVVRNNAGWNGRNLVGIYFPEVDREGGEPNRLNLVVLHDDPADEIIGRCIVGSLDWKLSAG